MNIETIARIRLYKRTVKWTNTEALIIESILMFLSKEVLRRIKAMNMKYIEQKKSWQACHKSSGEW